MGFLNSVSLAQNVHRNLVKWSSKGEEEGQAQVSELRKDRPFTVANPTWRVYLDNYDLLEKVEATGMVEVQGSAPEAVLALRQEYSVWEVPRNEKKSVQRSPHAELQGAMVDGVRGVAFEDWEVPEPCVDSHRSAGRVTASGPGCLRRSGLLFYVPQANSGVVERGLEVH